MGLVQGSEHIKQKPAPRPLNKRKEAYYDYLLSPYWQIKCSEALRLAKDKCKE